MVERKDGSSAVAEEGEGEGADLAEKKIVGHVAAGGAVDEDECGGEEGWVGGGSSGGGRGRTG
ncbi:hypothetical protein L484_017271 [Morus notabilis]|uniref:Uncharacterized protein n=1 Tax=Morus notabilis TaxID=981085 RepID=W9RSK9_9ROSA|nr:hypothetical protein L484_017271 [Morus notabilis]